MDKHGIGVKAVWSQDDRIFIRIAHGEERGMPPEWFPGLSNANQVLIVFRL